MANKKKVASVVAALCEAFGRTPTAATYKAYEIGLDGISDEAVDTAGNGVLRSPEFKFMPTPGQLRALAVTGGRGVDAQADLAWQALNHAIDTIGYTTSVNFRDGLINATVATLGGWERCCGMPTEEFAKWYRKDFIGTYSRLLASGCAPEQIRYLPGAIERESGGWVGKEYGRGGKEYQLPTPMDVAAEYTPMLESPPAAKQLTKRSSNIPRIEFQRP